MLRFKKPDSSEYPDWKERTLESVGSFYGGLSGKTKEDFGKGNGKFVTYMNVYKNTFSSQEMLEPVDVGSDEHQNTVSYGDILMSQSSETVEEVGLSSVYLFDDKPYLNSFCFGLHLRDHSVTKPEYMGYLMRSNAVRKQIMKEGQGISRINLSPNRIRNISLNIPCLEEQQKIANCLSFVDTVIADYEAQAENMQKQKKGVMQKLFSQEVRFKADDGSEYPEWETPTLESIGTFYGGLSGKTKDDFGKGEGKFVTYMNVYKNTFASHDMLELVEVTEGEKQNTVSYGDILMSQSSETVEEVGLSSVYLYDDEPYLNSFCFGFHLNDLNKTCPRYMGYLMRSDGVRKQITREGQGISRINLSPNRIRTIALNIPCLEEQQKIADCLSAFDDAIEDLQKTVEHWKSIKKGLLQQLFA